MIRGRATLGAAGDGVEFIMHGWTEAAAPGGFGAALQAAEDIMQPVLAALVDGIAKGRVL